LPIFYSLKAHCFGWESLVIFLATRGQRLPGTAGVVTLDPQIPSLMPYSIEWWFNPSADLRLQVNKKRKYYQFSRRAFFVREKYQTFLSDPSLPPYPDKQHFLRGQPT